MKRHVAIDLVMGLFIFGVFIWTSVGFIDPMPEWKTWPRKDGVPIATKDCQTDACLEFREFIIQSELQMIEEYEADIVEGEQE